MCLDRAPDEGKLDDERRQGVYPLAVEVCLCAYFLHVDVIVVFDLNGSIGLDEPLLLEVDLLVVHDSLLVD